MGIRGWPVHYLENGGNSLLVIPTTMNCSILINSDVIYAFLHPHLSKVVYKLIGINQRQSVALFLCLSINIYNKSVNAVFLMR